MNDDQEAEHERTPHQSDKCEQKLGKEVSKNDQKMRLQTAVLYERVVSSKARLDQTANEQRREVRADRYYLAAVGRVLIKLSQWGIQMMNWWG